MKKLSVVLTMVFLLSAVLVSGMARKPGTVNLDDDQKLKLLQPEKHDLQINCAGFDGRIYFVDDFVLSGTELEEGRLCFFLNSDFVFTELTVNGNPFLLREYKKVAATDIETSMNPDAFQIMDQKCRIYELVFDPQTEIPPRADIRLKYHLIPQDSLAIFTVRDNTLQMNGSDFWYPRNPDRSENVNLLVKTSDRMVFSLNGKAVDYTMTDTYNKEYRASFFDSQDSPAAIIFLAKQLK